MVGSKAWRRPPGAQFSVLPPENATGNFTKIVQRVPVRIVLDEKDARLGLLRPGLSVTAEVDGRPGAAAQTATAASGAGSANSSTLSTLPTSATSATPAISPHRPIAGRPSRR
jgi:membrane fusion protein (multidrug efflux system)